MKQQSKGSKTIDLDQPESNKGHKHLISAATVLVNEFKTPANYLKFLTEAITWMDRWSYKNRNQQDPAGDYNPNSCYFLTHLIDETAQPWLTGHNVIPKIAAGLKEIIDDNWYEYYHIYLSAIIFAYGYNAQEYFPSPSDAVNSLQSISALFKVGEHLDKYDDLLEIERDNMIKEAKNK